MSGVEEAPPWEDDDLAQHAQKLERAKHELENGNTKIGLNFVNCAIDILQWKELYEDS